MSSQMGHLDHKPVEEWTPLEVDHAMSTLGEAFTRYRKVFLDNAVSGKVLLQLDNEDCWELGIDKSIHRKAILAHVNDLRMKQQGYCNNPFESCITSPPSSPSPNSVSSPQFNHHPDPVPNQQMYANPFVANSQVCPQHTDVNPFANPCTAPLSASPQPQTGQQHAPTAHHHQQLHRQHSDYSTTASHPPSPVPYFLEPSPKRYGREYDSQEPPGHPESYYSNGDNPPYMLAPPMHAPSIMSCDSSSDSGRSRSARSPESRLQRSESSDSYSNFSYSSASEYEQPSLPGSPLPYDYGNHGHNPPMTLNLNPADPKGVGPRGMDPRGGDHRGEYRGEYRGDYRQDPRGDPAHHTHIIHSQPGIGTHGAFNPVPRPEQPPSECNEPQSQDEALMGEIDEFLACVDRKAQSTAKESVQPGTDVPRAESAAAGSANGGVVVDLPIFFDDRERTLATSMHAARRSSADAGDRGNRRRGSVEKGSAAGGRRKRSVSLEEGLGIDSDNGDQDSSGSESSDAEGESEDDDKSEDEGDTASASASVSGSSDWSDSSELTESSDEEDEDDLDKERQLEPGYIKAMVKDGIHGSQVDVSLMESAQLFHRDSDADESDVEEEATTVNWLIEKVPRWVLKG